MSEINCNIIKDLLPLYTENMLSEESKKAVEAHLSCCEACKTEFEQMKAQDGVVLDERKEEVKPLKKFRALIAVSIIGFPLWLPLTLAVGATLISVYGAIWACWLAACTLPISGIALFVGGAAASVTSFATADIPFGIMYLGTALAGSGIAVLSGYACITVFKAFIKATVWIFGKVKGWFKWGGNK